MTPRPRGKTGRYLLKGSRVTGLPKQEDFPEAKAEVLAAQQRVVDALEELAIARCERNDVVSLWNSKGILKGWMAGWLGMSRHAIVKMIEEAES